MKKTWILAAVGLLTVVLAVGAVACSDDDEDGDSSTPGVTEPLAETPADTTPAEGAAVSVNLTEYAVAPDTTAVAPGQVTFTAVNIGGTVHELVVIKTDLSPEALPTADDGSVDEAGEGMELIGEVEDVAAGEEGELAVDLEAGAYVLICNVVQQTDSGDVTAHYTEGMYSAFTVQ